MSQTRGALAASLPTALIEYVLDYFGRARFEHFAPQMLESCQSTDSRLFIGSDTKEDSGLKLAAESRYGILTSSLRGVLISRDIFCVMSLLASARQFWQERTIKTGASTHVRLIPYKAGCQ